MSYLEKCLKYGFLISGILISGIQETANIFFFLFLEVKYFTRLRIFSTIGHRNGRFKLPRKLGHTPLTLAAHFGDYGVTEALLQRKVIAKQINKLSSLGWSPLQYASNRGDFKLARLLVENKANVNQQDSSGYHTPFMLAVHGLHLDLAQFLLDNGAVLTPKNWHADNELSFAAGKNRLKVVKFLVRSGAPINHISEYGETALTSAVSCGHLEVVRWMVCEGKANTQAFDDKLRATPLYIAVSGKNLDMIRLLIRCGARVNDHPNYNWRILRFPIVKGNFMILELLLEEGGGDMNQLDAYFNDDLAKRLSLLSVAIMYKKTFIAEWLIQRGARINPKKDFRLAVQYGSLDLLKLVVKHGAIDIQGNEECLNWLLGNVWEWDKNRHEDSIVRWLAYKGASTELYYYDDHPEVIRGRQDLWVRELVEALPTILSEWPTSLIDIVTSFAIF